MIWLVICIWSEGTRPPRKVKTSNHVTYQGLVFQMRTRTRDHVEVTPRICCTKRCIYFTEFSPFSSSSPGASWNQAKFFCSLCCRWLSYEFAVKATAFTDKRRCKQPHPTPHRSRPYAAYRTGRKSVSDTH